MNARLAVTAALLLLLASCGTARDASTPTTSPSATSASPGQTSLDITDLETGTNPKIAWAQGRLLNGDAAREVLPAATDQFAQTKQLLVIRDIDGDVYAYSPDGPVGTTPLGKATGRLAINAEKNLVAWIAPDGSPTVLQEGEARPASLPKQDGVTAGDAVAIIGHDCFHGPEEVEGAGCSVYFRSTGSDKPQSYASSNHGFVIPIEESVDLLSLQDTDRVGEVGWTKLKDDQTTCSTYWPRDNAEGEPSGKSWNTCDHMPLAFSPDGKHILATAPHGYEGLGASSLTVLDRTNGKPLMTVRNTEKSQAAIVDMQWEDESHVLAVVTQKLDWAIVRVGLDGSMEFAGKPLRPQEELDGIPFRLAVQP